MTGVKNKDLRICFVGDASNVHTQKTVNYFVDKGYDVHLVDDHHYSYKGLKFHHVKNTTGISFIDFIIRLIRIPAIIRKIKPSLLHSFQATYHGFVAARSNAHPMILTPWGTDILYDIDKSFIHRFMILHAIEKSDFIHCIDENVRKRLKQICSENIDNKIFMLNEGVNTTLFNPKNKKKKGHFTILHLRVLYENRNAIVLIEALNILVNMEGRKDIRVIMISTGEKNYKKLIDEKIERYNLNEFITFFDWTNYKTQEFMSKCDVYVDTMHRKVAGQGAGKTMLEAMSSGVPVIVPDNPDMKVYIKNMQNGILYKGANPGELAKCIMMIMDNKTIALRISRNARKLIESSLDWDKNMARMEKKYHEIAENL